MPDPAARCAALLAAHFPGGGSWSEAEIAAVLDRPGGHVFENAGGVLIVSAVLDEAEIWTIAVDTRMRRQGYARDLIGQAIEKLSEQGVARLFLEVAEDNEPARHLYAALGFLETGRRRGYYRGRDGHAVDAILMARNLATNLA